MRDTETAVGRPLRIAFLGARGVVGTYSGIETYYEEVGSRLVERGHRVTAYCRSYFTPPLDTYRGLEIRRLPCLRGKHIETLSHSVLGTFDALLRSYDIVQYHAIGSAPLAWIPRLFGQRTVVSVRGLDWQRAKWGWFARSYLQFGEWASSRCPTATCVVSGILQEHYEATQGRRPEMIPNAVVPALRKPLGSALQALAQERLEPDGYLLFAGRLSPEKGVHTLLKAARPLLEGKGTGKKIVIAGGTSFTDEYIEQLRELAWDDVIFLGRVDREAMQELLSNCWAYVLPSAMEGLSIGLLEALSYGLCIFTTGIPENLEVVGDVALTFDFDDVEALRQHLASALASTEKVEEHRRRTAERAESWPDWDGVAERTEAFYRQILDPRRTRPHSESSGGVAAASKT